MHLKRQKSTTKLPIPRKGTTFVVKSMADQERSVPIVIAIRDLLKIARTSKEVKKMVNQRLIKVNGKPVTNIKQPLYLFSLLTADKTYSLSLLPTKKFTLQNSFSDTRTSKVINKKLVKTNKIQLNLHDGTNILTEYKINVGDSVVLDTSGKIKSHLPLEKGKSVFIFSGRYTGLEAKIKSIEGKKITVTLKDKDAKLNQNQLIVLK